MATTQAATDAVTRDGVVRRGDWTAERRGVLDKLSMEEIAVEILQLQAERAERLTIKPVRDTEARHGNISR